MVKKFMAYERELREVDSFPEGEEQWVPVVKYEDYAALETVYQAAIEHMVAVHQRYNSDATHALQKLYELSGKD